MFQLFILCFGPRAFFKIRRTPEKIYILYVYQMAIRQNITTIYKGISNSYFKKGHWAEILNEK